MQVSVDVVIDAITATLDEVAKELKGKMSNRTWTQKILSELADMPARVMGDGVVAYPNKDAGEWLFDMVWCRNENTGCEYYTLREIDLVLESEWSHNVEDVRYDFEKLLIAKSPLKVLIADDYRRAGTESDGCVTEMIEEELRSFSPALPSETYLVALYQGDGGVFKYRRYELVSHGGVKEWRRTDYDGQSWLETPFCERRCK